MSRETAADVLVIGSGAAGAALLLDERSDAADLDRPADLIESIAVVAHDAAGLGEVLQLLSKMQQRELPSSTLGQGGRSILLSELVVSNPNVSEGRMVAAVLSSPGPSGDLSDNYRATSDR